MYTHTHTHTFCIHMYVYNNMTLKCLAAFTERNTYASTYLHGNNAGACSLNFILDFGWL